MREARAAVREVFRVELPVAHLGLGIVLVACAAMSVFWSPVGSGVVAGAFAALFLAALAVTLFRGRRGWAAVLATYKFSFGWANWV
ncbi:hypothetical protein H9Y04_41885 [Streptomyces sp. TRM66268-LWL]|uniref:Uncharacterized protein n=1 Tax=Streptomyces polyasparticus TaxID=2767826 RepID=A0ABR7SUB2_9ACTN|nr:hypothetical protein [Streptomyces polyasparticus]